MSPPTVYAVNIETNGCKKKIENFNGINVLKYTIKMISLDALLNFDNSPVLFALMELTVYSETVSYLNSRKFQSLKLIMSVRPTYNLMYAKEKSLTKTYWPW